MGAKWTPYKGMLMIKTLVKNYSLPDEDWERIKVRIMYTTDNYKDASVKEKMAVETSHLESDESSEEEWRRKRRQNPSKANLKCPKTFHFVSPVLPQVPEDLVNRESCFKRSPVATRIFLGGSSVGDPPALHPDPHQQNTAGVNDDNFHMDNREATECKVFMRKVFRVLEELRAEARETRAELGELKAEIGELNRLLRGTNLKQSTSLSLPSDCPSLPLQNVEDVAEFENYLTNDDRFSLVCNFFSTIGGSSMQDCTRRILQYIIANPLSMKYNWKGTGGMKLPFSSLTGIVKLITGAVLNHQNFSSATCQDVENVIKKWLMHSKDRDGGRTQRLKKNKF